MFCPQCGKSLTDGSDRCLQCGLVLAPLASADIGQDAGFRMLLPVGRSGWAIAAGYAGLLSPLMCPAPLAIVFGILAVRDMRKNPAKHGMGRAIFGIVMGSLVCAIPLIALIVGVVSDLRR